MNRLKVLLYYRNQEKMKSKNFGNNLLYDKYTERHRSNTNVNHQRVFYKQLIFNNSNDYSKWS